MNIRNFISITTLFMFTVLISSCQESLEDRCKRECMEYTKTKCPVPIDQFTTLDSMVFNVDSRTIIYYFTLKSKADENIKNFTEENARNILLQELKNSTQTRLYKENDYSFRYIYRSQQSPQTIHLDILLKKEDYQ